MSALLIYLTRFFNWGRTRTQRWKQRWLQPLLTFLRSPRGRLFTRIIGFLLMGAALLFITVTLINSWQQIRPYLATINLCMLLWAQLCALIAYGLGGFLWIMVLRACAIRVSWQWGLLAHFIANAAKYIPGYGWQYISKGYLLREQGKSSREISIVLITEVVLLLSSGLVAALLAGAMAGQVWSYEWRIAPWLWWVGVVGVVGATVLWNEIFARLVGIGYVEVPRVGVQYVEVPREGEPHVEGPHAELPYTAPAYNVDSSENRRLHCHLNLGLGWMISFVGWLSFAAGVLLLVNALDPITTVVSLRADYLQTLFALVASGTISMLVIIVPGGFGIRETTLAALLFGLLTFDVATVVSVLARLSTMISELLGLGCLPYLLRHRSTSVNS